MKFNYFQFVIGFFLLLSGLSAMALQVTPSEEEKALYKLITDYRAANGLAAVPLSSSLTHVAQTHARDLADNPPSGNCNMHSWSNNGSWTGCCYTPDHAQGKCMWDKPKELTRYSGRGYEISAGGGGSGNISAETALRVWQGSGSHNNVILNQGQWADNPWQAIGVGIYKGYAVVWFGMERDSEGSLESGGAMPVSGNPKPQKKPQKSNCTGAPQSGSFNTSDGSRIYYETEGCGPPLLLIHGGDCVGSCRDPYSSSEFKAARSWEPQITEFSKHYKVVRYDIRGFGRSTSSTGHRLDNWKWSDREDPTVKDAVELLRHLGIEQAHVLGLSIGSGVAAQLAVYHPDKVDKLILVSPWMEHSLSFSNPRQAAALNAIQDKTLLILGKQDGAAHRELVNAREENYQPRVEKIDNANHFCNSDQPAIFNKLVMDFLAGSAQGDKLLSVEFGWGGAPEQFGLQQGEELETFGAHTFTEDAQGNKYIADPINDCIKVLDSQGRYQRNIPLETFPTDLTLAGSDIVILDAQGLAVIDERGKIERHELSSEIPALEGYGQGFQADSAGNIYVCKTQECYRVIEQSGGKLKVLSPTEQFDSVMPGCPLANGKWLRAEWQGPKQARFVIFNDDAAIERKVPLKMPDAAFGAITFIGEDKQGRLYFEIERITDDQVVHLDLSVYDQQGKLLGTEEYPNEYYSTVYKKLSVDRETGRVQQMYTTKNGVEYEELLPPQIEISSNASETCSAGWKIEKTSTAPRGCWCSGASPTPLSNTEAHNKSPGGGGNDGKKVVLSNQTTQPTRFHGFLDKSTYFLTRTTYCVDPECGRRYGVTNYQITETHVCKNEQSLSTSKPALPSAVNSSNTLSEESISRYIAYSDGTALDTETGLMWMRCLIGQDWQVSGCTGSPAEYSWHEAKEVIPYSFAGYADWRLPTIKELRTLIYCSNGKPDYFSLGKTADGKAPKESSDIGCGGNPAKDHSVPTIVTSVFPNSNQAVDAVWSSSPYSSKSSLIRFVHFQLGDGNNATRPTAYKLNVRLVRNKTQQSKNGQFCKSCETAFSQDGVKIEDGRCVMPPMVSTTSLHCCNTYIEKCAQ